VFRANGAQTGSISGSGPSTSRPTINAGITTGGTSGAGAQSSGCE
jgi:hypothetical protein